MKQDVGAVVAVRHSRRQKDAIKRKVLSEAGRATVGLVGTSGPPAAKKPPRQVKSRGRGR